MIKTPLSTVIGGAFWTPGATVIGGNTPAFDQQIQKLFANGEQGFFYDTNDLSTMFQDAAGTVPVTAAGQAVGLILDKSGRGNHASQTASASRPILRKNAVTGVNYLEFDGSDDFLQTSNIDFTATSEITVITGVRKNSDSGRSMLLEFGETAGARAFSIEAPQSVDNNYSAMLTSINAGNFSRFRYSPYVAPTSNVLSFIFKQSREINSERIIARIDGKTPSSSNISQGEQHAVSNFSIVRPIYIGRRGGTTLPFNGHIYGLIGVGKLATESETTALERDLAKRTGVTLL